MYAAFTHRSCRFFSLLCRENKQPDRCSYAHRVLCFCKHRTLCCDWTLPVCPIPALTQKEAGNVYVHCRACTRHPLAVHLLWAGWQAVQLFVGSAGSQSFAWAWLDYSWGQIWVSKTVNSADLRSRYTGRGSSYLYINPLCEGGPHQPITGKVSNLSNEPVYSHKQENWSFNLKIV